MAVMPLELLPLPQRKLPDDDKPHARLEHEIPLDVVEARVLTPEEVEQYIKPAYEAAKAPMPGQSFSAHIGIVRDGKPTGSFLTVQLSLHAEPLNLVQGDEATFGLLIAEAEKQIVQTFGNAIVYVFVPPGRVARLAQIAGMQPEPWTVMSMIVGPDAPKEPTQ